MGIGCLGTPPYSQQAAAAPDYEHDPRGGRGRLVYLFSIHRRHERHPTCRLVTTAHPTSCLTHRGDKNSRARAARLGTNAEKDSQPRKPKRSCRVDEWRQAPVLWDECAGHVLHRSKVRRVCPFDLLCLCPLEAAFYVALVLFTPCCIILHVCPNVLREHRFLVRAREAQEDQSKLKATIAAFIHFLSKTHTQFAHAWSVYQESWDSVGVTHAF